MNKIQDRNKLSFPIDIRKPGKLHFALFLLLLVNFIMFQLFGIRLHVLPIFWCKVIWWLLGIILFFMTFKRPGMLRVYFSFFVLYPIVVVVAWLLDRLMGVILASFLTWFFGFPNAALKAGEYSFYDQQGGLLAPCCTNYYLTQTKYIIFRKKIGEVKLDEGRSLDDFQFKVMGHKGYLSGPERGGLVVEIDLP